MIKNLVIVESPAKAKTIEGFLGKDFVVKSSYGHIRDLPKKDLSIDVNSDFKPLYEIPEDKEKIVKELRKIAKDAETVWLATDEDREGESISWHLAEVLELDQKALKRIVFHEITKSSILNAISNPRAINKDLVDAQQARRILDRLVGFEISPILWRKVKPALSAGRVQSVAVRLIVEREKEIENFKISPFFKVLGQFGLFNNSDKKINASLNKRFNEKAESLAFLNKCINAEFTINNIDVKPVKKSPPPPFTTSTLQQEASRLLGFSVSKTMMVAQQLYESGKITYMRTDSVNLSDSALANTKKEIIELYGNDYSKPRKYVTKTKGAQEAHEAIRPSYMENKEISGDSSQQRLYQLIWKRTIASQMTDASLEKTNITIDISKADEKFIATGELIIFDGFLKVYEVESKKEDDDDDDTNGILPKIKVGEKLNADKISAIQRFTQHAARFSEASLVRRLEELGIGRPSTYAPIINTIQNRQYVVKEDRKGTARKYSVLTLIKNEISEKEESELTFNEKGKLYPTDIGVLVNNFLVKYFETILDYNFTAKIEKEFDEIAQGNLVWNEMIKIFYSTFHNTVIETAKNSEKTKGEKLLGVDEASGKNVYVKIGRFGAIAQIGDVDSKDKPTFASLKKGQSIEKITLAEALELFNKNTKEGYLGVEPKTGFNLYAKVGKFGPFLQIGDAESLGEGEKPRYVSLKKGTPIDKLTLEEALTYTEFPKIVGKYNDNDIIVSIGGYGPYIKCGTTNYPIPKTEDMTKIDEIRAIEIIEKKKSPSKEVFKEFDANNDVKIMSGPYGYYINSGKSNYKIPAGKKVEELDLDECLKIISETKPTERKKTFFKKKKTE